MSNDYVFYGAMAGMFGLMAFVFTRYGDAIERWLDRFFVELIREIFDIGMRRR